MSIGSPHDRTQLKVRRSVALSIVRRYDGLLRNRISLTRGVDAALRGTPSDLKAGELERVTPS